MFENVEAIVQHMHYTQTQILNKYRQMSKLLPFRPYTHYRVVVKKEIKIVFLIIKIKMKIAVSPYDIRVSTSFEVRGQHLIAEKRLVVFAHNPT